MKVAIFWTGVTATMAAAYRAFAAVPGVHLKLFIELPKNPDTAFNSLQLLAGLDAQTYQAGNAFDPTALCDEVAAFGPDVMLVLGWRSVMCRAVAESGRFARVPKVFAFDMPFAMSIRKLLAPFVLRRYLRRFVAAFVTGERAAAYARHLGFHERQITTGLFGMDAGALLAARFSRPEPDRYPRRFLYVGRYVPEKGIPDLVAGYAQYRGRVRDPWPLTCAGMGPEAGRLIGQPGISDAGFVQPSDLPALFAEHGCFVIASRYDPWPMVIAEALGAGMPVICTAACGSSVELVKPYFNGIVCGTGSPESLAEALAWVHRNDSAVPLLGGRGPAAAEPYGAEAWAARFHAVCARAMAR